MSQFNRHTDQFNPPGPSNIPPTATIDLLSLVNENSSIKIISPVDEYVNDDGVVFSSALDDNTRHWLDNIQKSWDLWKKCANTINLLYKFFESVENPYLYSLKLVVNYRCKSECKNNTLPYLTIEELKKWSGTRMPHFYEHLNHEIKFAAFNIAKEKKYVPFLKLVADTYQISNEDIKNYINEMLDEKQYLLACHSIIAFNIRVENIMDNLLFPLVLQDKTMLVTDYLSAFPDQALDFVKFLDSFVGNNTSFKDQIYNYLSEKRINVSQIKWDKVHYKTFGKFISRICTKYHISLSLCHNLTNQRAIGGLRYLIHQRYNNTISENAWNDMVVDAINENPHLIQELVTLVDHYNTKDACKWAKFFNCPEELCPENMRLYMQRYMNEESDDDNKVTPSTSQNFKYHNLAPSISVVFVNSPQLFIDAVCNEIANETVIGIDSEWKPSFGTKKSTVSLIQISTRSNVYLFDALNLNDDKHTELWTLLSNRVLENPNIIKLGFGIENDMREIKSSILGLKLLKYKDFNFIEVQTLWKAITHAGVRLPYKKENTGEGLSAIVQQCFGSSLKKHEQCSNWEIRPLRDSQIEYAALDAYVLLEIYNLFDELCQKINLNIEDVCNRVRENAEKARMRKQKKKTTEKYVNCNNGPNSAPVLPENTKILLEYCLEPLARYLRCIGIDAELIDNGDPWENSVQKALSENRYIVIKYLSCKRVSKLIPRNHVYVLESYTLEEQFREMLNYFNVTIKMNNLFKRCDNCNSDNISIIDQSIMNQMKTSAKTNSSTKEIPTLVSSNRQVSYDHSGEDCNDYDDFLSDKEEEYDEVTLAVDALVLSPENIDINKCLTQFHVSIQFENISDSALNNNTEFHICQLCGKCFYRFGYLPDNLLNVIMYMIPSHS